MITGVILARNEARNIVPCLEALRPHVEELLLIDMASTDETVELARPLVQRVLTHPLVANFDAARNTAIPEAQHEWLWFVDADERISEATARVVRDFVRERGDEFVALSIPFKSYFCGQWMRHCGWWPGYTMPRVLKRGHFRFSEKLHGGVEVEGPEARVPPDPALGVDHLSYESIEHYLEKLNRYTSTEAAQLRAEGKAWDWRQAMAAMLHDLWMYYEAHPGRLDGERGWILSWLSGQYRWLQHAKLVDQVPSMDDNSTASREINAPVKLDDMLLFLEEELAALRRRRPRLPLGLVWRSPLFDYSGYADEGRAFCKALAISDRPLVAQEIRWSDKTCALPPGDAALLRALLRGRRAPSTAVITDCIPTLVTPDRGAALNILRTTFEVDRLPGDWLPHVEAFDEVWVTSTFAAQTFRRSGIAPESIRVVQPCIDTELFTADGRRRAVSAELTGRFVFLSVLEWQLRKGWDVLLRAYAREFTVDDGVGLLLKVTRQHGQPEELVRSQADDVLAECGTSLAERPDIAFLWEVLEATEMAALYRGAGAFVLPSRGEGWGRPYMEALACGLPVLATGESGQADFLHAGNSLLIMAREVAVSDQAAREIPTYGGARWFEPDEGELRAALRRMMTDSEARERLAAQGLRDVAEQYSLEKGREAVEHALTLAERPFMGAVPGPVESNQLRVELDGELFAGHSFANINEHLARGFTSDPGLALSVRRRFHNPPHDNSVSHAPEILPLVGRELPGGSQVTIRHAFPPDFERPKSGKWVHIQPWEFGHLPVAWIAPLRDEVDEIWAPSRYVKRVYERSGIPAEKIHVIPWGIDPEVFNPEAPPLHLPTTKTFKFLFVGGTIQRKGFDRLLEAYLQEFTREDDVCLVIKDQGTDTFYRYGNGRAGVLALMDNPVNPEIVYFDRSMTPGQLASLYTACDSLAMPYRGEGFGLPILEAMACGLPPIVPRGGASDDFVTDETGYLLPATEIESKHDWPLVGPALELDVGIEDLRRALRAASEEHARTRDKGAVAARHIHNRFTWRTAIAAMRARLTALASSASAPTPADPRGRRPNLAACLPARDGERALAECLTRLAPFVGELIVCDAGSRDRSLHVAREFGARIVPAGDCVHPSVARAQWLFFASPRDDLDVRDLAAVRELAATLPPSLVHDLTIAMPRSRIAGAERPQLELLRVARSES